MRAHTATYTTPHLLNKQCFLCRMCLCWAYVQFADASRWCSIMPSTGVWPPPHGFALRACNSSTLYCSIMLLLQTHTYICCCRALSECAVRCKFSSPNPSVSAFSGCPFKCGGVGGCGLSRAECRLWSDVGRPDLNVEFQTPEWCGRPDVHLNWYIEDITYTHA